MSRPADARRGTGSRVGLVALVILAVAACGGLPGNQGDPSAPVLVTGRVLDAHGVPVGGATLQLEVFDQANAQVGQRIPDVFRATYTAGLDGTFSIHLAAPADLVAFSAKNDGFVYFHLLAIAPDTSLFAPSGFPRELKSGTWVDEVPVLELHLSGGG